MKDWEDKELNPHSYNKSHSEHNKFLLNKIYKPRIKGFSILLFISLILLGISVAVYFHFEKEYMYTTFIVMSGTFSLTMFVPLVYYVFKSLSTRK